MLLTEDNCVLLCRALAKVRCWRISLAATFCHVVLE